MANRGPGQTLTVTPAPLLSGWSGENTYQWLRGSAEISGATSTTYTVTDDDVGSAVTCRQTHRNSAGADSATSAAIDVITNEAFVATLFDGGEDGGWYDPSDLTSMLGRRLEATSTGPAADEIDPFVSGVGAVVGTVLDKSQLGGRTVQNYVNDPANNIWPGAGISTSITNAFDSAGAVTDNGDGTYTLEETVGTSTSNNYPRINFTNVFEVGKTYYFEFTVANSSGVPNGIQYVRAGPSGINRNTFVYLATTGTNNGDVVKGIAYAGDITLQFLLDTVSGGIFSFDITNVKLVEIPGNHLVAPSDAARPVLRDEPIVTDPLLYDLTDQPEQITDPNCQDLSGEWIVSLPDATHKVTQVTEGFRFEYASTAGGQLRDKDFDPDDNQWYIIETECVDFSGTGRIKIDAVTRPGSDAIVSVPITDFGTGTFRALFRKPSLNLPIYRVDSDVDLTLSRISVKPIPASAARRYYLDFDGVDDGLLCSFALATLSATSTFVTSWKTNDDLGVLHGEAETGDYSFVFGDNGTSVALQSNSSTAAATYYIVNGVSNYTDGVTDRDDVHSWLSTGTSFVASVQFPATQWAGFSASGYTGFMVDGAWYGAAFIDRALTTAERENLEIFLANKSGAVLA